MKCPILRAAKIIALSPLSSNSDIDNCMQTECEWWDTEYPDTKIGNCAILGFLFEEE